jgi:hypothetical protein
MTRLYRVRISGTVTSFVESTCESGLNATEVRRCFPLGIFNLFLLCNFLMTVTVAHKIQRRIWGYLHTVNCKGSGRKRSWLFQYLLEIRLVGLGKTKKERISNYFHHSSCEWDCRLPNKHSQLYHRSQKLLSSNWQYVSFQVRSLQILHTSLGLVFIYYWWKYWIDKVTIYLFPLFLNAYLQAIHPSKLNNCFMHHHIQ